jgi:hypothetical protein
MNLDGDFFYWFFSQCTKESEITDAYLTLARGITRIYTHDKQEMGKYLLLMDQTYKEFYHDFNNFAPVH